MNTADAPPPALSMRGITKRFGAVTALDGVSFAVRGGSVHALVGENGAGKSTLMKILAGVHRPDDGTLELRGRRVRFQTPHDALRAGVSMIYQEFDLAEDMTVAENVFLGAEPRWLAGRLVAGREMITRTREIAAEYGFSLNPRAVVRGLSAADKQIVEIVRALRRSASILVLDEPTSSLSEAEAGRLLDAVRALRARGIAIVYISHRLEEVLALADEISVLRDGRCVHSGSAGGLDVPHIVRLMVGRELSDFYPPRDALIGDVRVRVRGLASARGIRDVSFDVRAGEVVGMAGLIGAGRTETARAIFGVDRRTAGTVEIDDRPVAARTPSDAIAAGVALLTEDRKASGLCLDLSCCANITLAALGRLGMKRVIRPGAERAAAVRLAERLAVRWAGPLAPASALSGGNQQKLLIARWLLTEARFVIFDEPTRGIDVAAKREVHALINALADEGKAILLISSELPEIFGAADRILVMRRRRLVADVRRHEVTPEEVMRLAAVEEAAA